MYGLIGHETDSEISDVVEFIAGFSRKPLPSEGQDPCIFIETNSLLHITFVHHH